MNKKKFKRKKLVGLISLLIVLSIIVSPLHVMKADSITNEVQEESFTRSSVDNISDVECVDKYNRYKGNGYEVELAIDSQWEDAFNGNITIINTGTVVIEDWVLEFNMDNQIVNIWNGIIHNHEGSTYVIKSAGWNQDIPVGGSINFGFSATGNIIYYPESYIIPTSIQNADETCYSIEFTLYSDWGVGYSAAITITNNGDKIIEDWILEFDFGKRITDIWNGVIYSYSDDHYVIKNASYNQNILPGQSLSIGFNGIDGNITDNPQNYKLSEYVIGNYDNNLNNNDSNDNADENKYNTISTEDPMIGIAYFQELVVNDICIEEDGIQYAKNQINLVGTEGSHFEQFENLGESYDFEIVGYIEFSKDYQIKFFEDKTYQQMKDYVLKFLQYDFIEEANINLVIEIENDYFPINDPEWPSGASNNVWTHTSNVNWGAVAINAPVAWDYINDMYPIKIGLIDNMFDRTHEDLNFKKIWNNPVDSYVKGSNGDSHGTHVAGTMSAGFDNGVGISGIAVNKELYAYSTEGKTDDISKKMNMTVMEYKYAFSLLIGNDVRVINVSQNTGRLECYAASMGNSAAINYVEYNAKVLGSFLKKLINRGFDFVIVTAAGNVNNKNYIADVNEVYGYRLPKSGELGVQGGALAKYNSFLNNISEIKNRIIVVGAYGLGATSISSYSNIGTRVDIVAPGDNIYSTIIGNAYDYMNGTSMAAPHVAGTAALVYSVNPALTGYQVKDIIKSTANAVGLTESSGTYTYDTVNAGEAVKKALATKGVNFGVSNSTGIIFGKVQGDGSLSDAPIENVMISAYRY